MTWFQTAWNWIVSLGKNPIVQKFWTFLKSLFSQEFSLVMQQLVALAVKVCGDLENTDLSGPDKQAKAFAIIEADAIAAGLSVTSSMINLAIELVVQAFKQNALAVPAASVATPAAQAKGKK